MTIRIGAVALATVSALTLAACAPPTPDAPSAGGPPTVACNDTAAQAYVGQPATTANVEAARLAAGAAIVRTVRPGEVVTMEFRADRLTLQIDAAGNITGASCG
jgi:hypothetical protein